MTPTTPRRHICLTAYLILMLVVNIAMLAACFFDEEGIEDLLPDAPIWLSYVLVAGGYVLNIFLILALFRWKKWAFYACCLVAVARFFVNLSLEAPLFGAVMGLLGPAILYGVLQIGKENKGWPQLK